MTDITTVYSKTGIWSNFFLHLEKKRKEKLPNSECDIEN